MISMMFKILGSLGLFLYGMRVLSEGIQKVAGDRMQRIMNYMTRNRLMAVLTGLSITALVQSSSATTVMVVSFVNASLLNLSQAIGVVMGANIGTTVTTWIVSFIGFKFKITAIALPIIGIGLPFIFSKIRRRRDMGECFIGFGLLFLGLFFLKSSVPDINSNPEVLAFLQNYTDLGFMSFVIFVLVGAILTLIVQSSSAAMTITITMAFMGWIDFQTSAAIVLGENIGTTVTAYLASLGTSVNARRTARAHFLFNTMGVIWMAFLFPYFIKLVCIIAPWDYTLQENLPLNLSLFHTLFNVTNTMLFIPFVERFRIVVEKLVSSGEKDELGGYELQYISTGIRNTAQMNILEAKNEITRMAQIVDQMFHTVLHLIKNPDMKMGNKIDEVRDQEILTDRMQEEITRYLVECSKEELSERSVMNVKAMMRIVNELENIGDSCYKILLLTQRKYDKKLRFHEKAQEEFEDISSLILEFMDLYKKRMNEHLDSKVLDLAYKLEDKINHLRDNLKKASQKRLSDGAEVKGELLYLDLLKHFEHIGDNSLNIAQALREVY
jgi:phosphate:Na+ symporter